MVLEYIILEGFTGPEFIHYFIKRALDLKVEMKLNTMVTSLSHENGCKGSSPKIVRKGC